MPFDTCGFLAPRVTAKGLRNWGEAGLLPCSRLVGHKEDDYGDRTPQATATSGGRTHDGNDVGDGVKFRDNQKDASQALRPTRGGRGARGLHRF